MTDTTDTIERACEVMHDAYEAAAVTAGWQTQERSRVPWSEVPEANKVTMRAAVAALLDHIAPPTTGPVHLLVGDMPDSIAPPCEHCTGGHGSVAQLGGRLLVHVWADGTGEVAWRESDDSRIGWGVPTPLVVAP